jgi:hypothetical protein
MQKKVPLMDAAVSISSCLILPVHSVAGVGGGAGTMLIHLDSQFGAKGSTQSDIMLLGYLFANPP